MATAITEPLAATTVSWAGRTAVSHAKADEILRQVEYYFSEENLPKDAYLLGFTGREGTDPVSLSLILGFKKMKQFRPLASVREVLKGSTVVEVMDKNYIRRRHPLRSRITVQIKIDENRYKKQLAECHPHLPKTLLERTGFEDGITNGPITPAQAAKNHEHYDQRLSIVSRMESAINNYAVNRKMHQDERFVFEKFIEYGGFDVKAPPFSGRMTKKMLKEEGYGREEMPSPDWYDLTELVQEAFWKEADHEILSDWEIDFVGVAKGFLCGPFMSTCTWQNRKHIANATKVMGNMYEFFLYHDVCKESEAQIFQALRVCEVAKVEFPKLAIVDSSLPGAFNTACSVLAGGKHNHLHISEAARKAWATESDNMGLGCEEAAIVFKAAVAAFGNREQNQAAQEALDRGKGLKCVAKEDIGLKVIGVEMPSKEVEEMYAALAQLDSYKDIVHPMGKLICRRWESPFQPPADLPPHVVEAQLNRKDEVYEFIIETDVLQHVDSGIKIKGMVCELDVGMKWIESVDAIYPTFCDLLLNERVFDWKAPGPPKDWQNRQTAKMNGESEAATKPK